MSGAALFNLAQTALTSDAGNISSSSSRDGLARAASMPLQRQRNGAAKPPLEWRRFLTVEDCVETNQWIFVNPHAIEPTLSGARTLISTQVLSHGPPERPAVRPGAENH